MKEYQLNINKYHGLSWCWSCLGIFSWTSIFDIRGWCFYFPYTAEISPLSPSLCFEYIRTPSSSLPHTPLLPSYSAGLSSAPIDPHAASRPTQTILSSIGSSCYQEQAWSSTHSRWSFPAVSQSDCSWVQARRWLTPGLGKACAGRSLFQRRIDSLVFFWRWRCFSVSDTGYSFFLWIGGGLVLDGI